MKANWKFQGGGGGVGRGELNRKTFHGRCTYIFPGTAQYLSHLQWHNLTTPNNKFVSDGKTSAQGYGLLNIRVAF